MSFLDVAPHEQPLAMGPQPGEQARLPVGPGEAFSATWNESQLFGQSVAGQTARMRALNDYVGEIKQKTGVDITADTYTTDPGGAYQDWNATNEAVAKLKAQGQDVNPLSDQEIEDRAVALSRAARSDYAAMSSREKGPGGTLGSIAGSFAGGAVDPINLLALPAAPADGLPLLAYALRWGAIAAATQGAVEIAGAPYREEVQPGYLSSGEPLLNVAGAAVGGAALGGGTRVAATVLGRLWGRAKTGEWPTSVRDAGNLAESEANVVQSNIYPGAAGEAAHRDALATAADQVIKGDPVNIADHITPEIAAAGEARLAPIMDARAAAIGADEAAKAERAAAVGEPAPELPFEATAKQAASEAAVARVADHVQQISRGEAPGIDAYHGSPHDFDAFSMQHIGTGEGAQVYGHGLYFAEHPETAKAYAETTSRFTIEGKPIDQSNPAHIAALAIDRFGETASAEIEGTLVRFRSALENAREYAKKDVPAFEADIKANEQAKALIENRAALPQIEKNSNLYRVRINADPEHFLDWDKPLSEQSAHVQSVLRPIAERYKAGSRILAELNIDELSGENLLRAVRQTVEGKRAGHATIDDAMRAGPSGAETSRVLSDAGIPGIKYLDQGSRPIQLSKAYREHLEAELRSGDAERAKTAQEELDRADIANPTRNFVVFDDKDVSITEKNGVPTMPREDAEKLAKMIMKADEPQAQAIVQAIQERPQTVADFPPRAPKEAPEQPATVLPPAEVAKVIGSPEHEAALRADIDRARMTGDLKIPAGVDQEGNPVFRSLDAAMDEVDAFKQAADHIQACANPVQEPTNG